MIAPNAPLPIFSTDFALPKNLSHTISKFIFGPFSAILKHLSAAAALQP